CHDMGMCCGPVEHVPDPLGLGSRRPRRGLGDHQGFAWVSGSQVVDVIAHDLLHRPTVGPPVCGDSDDIDIVVARVVVVAGAATWGCAAAQSNMSRIHWDLVPDGHAAVWAITRGLLGYREARSSM